MFKLLTPGGGGYGEEETEVDVDGRMKNNKGEPSTKFVERGSVYEFRSMQESA